MAMATAEQAAARTARVFVVLNPKSGSCSVEDVREALRRHFPGEGGACEVHELAAGSEIAEVVRGAVAAGAGAVVAAGGDGTVSAVAGGLVGSGVPLGILPLGTANVLARELGVPVALEAACALLAGPHRTAALDAMRVGDRRFFTQVGVGIDALMIRDTPTEQKRRFGRAAYLWTGFVRLLGFQPRRFEVVADDRATRLRGLQVVVANVGTLGQPPFRWGPGIRLDDGQLSVCLVRARTLLDFAALAWHVVRGQHSESPHVRYLEARRSVSVAADRPLPVQADGEIIGETPVVVHLEPAALRVIVPAEGEGRPAEEA